MQRRKYIFSSISIGIFLLLVTMIWQYTTWIRHIPCHRLIDTRLQSVDFSRLTPGHEEEWIDKNFYLNRNQLSTRSRERIWWWYGLTNKYRLRRTEYATWLDQLWIRPMNIVHVSDMIRCLGEPDSYLSVTELDHMPLYALSFLYEEEGYIFMVQYFYTDSQPPITLGTELFYVVAVPPSNSQEMIYKTRIRHEKDKPTELVEALRQWPGDIAEIEVPTIFVR